MRVSSVMASVDLRQDPRPLVIGERLNALGSAATKKCMLDNDIDGLTAIARQQVEEEGAHCLDVCMANTEGVDEKILVLSLVKRLGQEVPAPLVIDSTEHDVIEAAVRQAAGLPIINSISLEEGRFDENVDTMVRYGCPAIAMCAGPAGVVKTAREKVELGPGDIQTRHGAWCPARTAHISTHRRSHCAPAIRICAIRQSRHWMQYAR